MSLAWYRKLSYRNQTERPLVPKQGYYGMQLLRNIFHEIAIGVYWQMLCRTANIYVELNISKLCPSVLH
jgi:hypothetical protein